MRKGTTDEELVGEEETLYRAAVARGIYLAQDRSDIGFAVKELAGKWRNRQEGIKQRSRDWRDTCSEWGGS
jgi:hypothetical protein